MREAVQRGLTALCSQVMREPFGILREAGLQAELRTLLLKQPELRQRVPVKIIAHDSTPQGRFVWSADPLRCPLLRVQLEMKIVERSKKGQDIEDRLSKVAAHPPTTAPDRAFSRGSSGEVSAQAGGLSWSWM